MRPDQELAWWRDFHTCVTPDSEMPTLGRPLLRGQRFVVKIERARHVKPPPPPPPEPGDPITVHVPCRVWSVNEERRWHWRQRADAQRQVREAAALLAAKVGAQLTPVTIEVTPLLPRGRRQDAGNCVTVAKPAIDGLVDAGVIPDDSGRYLSAVTFRAPEPCERAADEGLRLTIQPRRQEAPA